MKSGKQLLIFALSCAAIVLGVYMTFFNRNRSDSKSENESIKEMDIEQGEEKKEEYQMEETNSYDYSGKDLPMEENETDAETYNNGKSEISIYFSNTELLDQGKIPLAAQAVLCEEVQRYLKHSGYGDVTELYINDESYQEDSEKIAFVCFMDGYEEVLQIEYWFNVQTLKYFILDSDEYKTGGMDAEE